MVNALLIGVKGIKTELITADQEDNDTRADAQRKSQHVNDREHLVTDDIPPGDLEIVFEHGTIFLLVTTNLIS
jgi:hypothetical protein